MHIRRSFPPPAWNLLSFFLPPDLEKVPSSPWFQPHLLLSLPLLTTIFSAFAERGLSPELQKLKFEHHEKLRKDRLAALKEERARITAEGERQGVGGEGQ